MRTMRIVLSLACLLPLAVHGQSSRQSAATSGLKQALDALFVPLISTRQVPGFSVAIVEGGRAVYAKGFGSTQLTEQLSPTPDTQYRLASVSKPFTAVAVFRLIQDGAVKLDEPARSYCPELSPLNGAPTVRQFLTHRSGMRHTTDAEDTTTKGAVTSFGASLSKVVREPLRFTPGAKTLYTSWGYTALGCVIERSSARSYADYMRERVFAPAALTGTTFDWPGYTSPTFSSGYRTSLLGGFRPSDIVDTRFKTPSSGIISTVSDLTRFASALLEGRLISTDLVTEMFRVVRDGDGRTGFTAGWTPQGQTALGAVFDYNGSMEGATAFLEMVPERRYTLALLANRERFVPQLQPIVNQARGIVLGALVK